MTNAQDLSLYHLALGAQTNSQTLSVSPATLKSLVAALIDEAIALQIPLELWVKLPPGKVWSAEIDRYHDRAGVPHTIYTCNSPESEVGSLDDSNLRGDRNGGKDTAPTSQIIPVWLASHSQISQEYFWLLLSDRFCGLIAVNKPLHSQQLVEETPKKHLLQVVCTFDRQTVQRFVEGVRNCIVTAETVRDKSLLGSQGSLFVLPESPATLLSQVLARLVQRQEILWRQVESDRADSADKATLRQENEVLLNDLHLKDEFIENVVQELRTPLTNMKTAMTLLEAAHLKPAQRQRYMHLLHAECDRQSSLINGLLDMVRLERVGDRTDKQAVHLGEVVPGVVSTYQAIAQEKGIQLGYTVSSALPPVCCFEAWLRQIVINLLHNSIKFTPNGGQVWVRTKQQGEYVQLEVRDTGIGIAPHELPKIFDRFYRGRPTGSEDSIGAGLGLTVVQQLLLRCGGSISVTSKLGEGSTFKVLLPIDRSTSSNG